MRAIGRLAVFWIIACTSGSIQAAPSRTDLATGFSLDESPDKIRVGFMVSGDAVLTATRASRGDLIVSVPVVRTQAGVLRADVKGKRVLMPAGARVFRGVFAVGAGQSEPLLGWCGAGFRGGDRDRRPGIVCLLETPDGRATLAAGSDRPGREWYADGVRLTDVDARTDRPEVEIVDGSSSGPMRFEYRFVRADEGQLAIERSVVGPGAEADEEARFVLGYTNLAVRDYLARVDFGAASLELRVADDRRSVTAAWGPPIDAPVNAASKPDDTAPLEPAPFTFGAVRFDLDSFTFSEGPVAERQLLARGTGARRKVLRAQESAKVQALLAGMTNERVQAGAVFHDVEFFEKNSLGMWARTSTLCGPFDLDTIRGPSVSLRCLIKPAAGDTYNVFIATPSRPWLSGARYVTFAGQSSIQLRFNELAEDPIGSFDILIGVIDISRTWAHIGAAVRRDAEEVPFWSSRARFNGAGEARFPFWDRVLVVRRSGEKAITGAFEMGGDGAGFYGFEGLLPAVDLKLK